MCNVNYNVNICLSKGSRPIGWEPLSRASILDPLILRDLG